MQGRTRTTGVRIAVVVLALVILAGCDWNQLSGFGPAGTSFNPSEPALTTASVAHLTAGWSKPCTCASNRPLIVGNTVYVIDGYTGETPFALTLRALDTADGHTKWSTPLGASGSGGALAAVANGLVYLTVHPFDETGDRLVAIDATSGAVRWRIRPPTGGVGYTSLITPVVDGSVVYVAATASGSTSSTEVSAFDTNGQRLWTVVPGGQPFPGHTLAIDPGKTLYIASYVLPANSQLVNVVHGFAVADGTLRSTAILPTTPPIQDLAVADGLLFGTFFTDFGRESGEGGFAVHPDTGAIAWIDGLFLVAVTPNVAITTNPRTGDLVAHDPATGATVWANEQAGTTGVATDQLLFFSNGTIRSLADGTVAATLTNSDTDPIEFVTPSNGRIFVSSNNHLSTFTPAGP